MGDGTKVHLGDLNSHQQSVDGIMRDLHGAVNAGGQAGALFDINAFGIVGQIFAAPIQIWVQSAKTAMDDTVSAGDEISKRLKDSHKDYTENEKTCQQLFTSIHKGLS